MILAETDILIRLLVSALLGGIIGLEREWSHKVAGLRTHALVAIGACLLTIISISGFSSFMDGSTSVRYDPSRIISNIIVGIGFIGGGAILKKGNQIQGITTAATLWVVAAIGISTGVGFIREAILTTVIVYFILSVLYKLERWLDNKRTIPEG